MNNHGAVEYVNPPAGAHDASRKCILLYGPPVNLKTKGLIGGGAGGYARNMAIYLSALNLEKYVLVPVFHTVRRDFSNGLLSKIRRFVIDAWKSMYALIKQRPAAVHVLAQYRDALPREVLVAAVCSFLRIPFIYDIKGGMFIDAYHARGRWYRWGIRFIVRRAAGILGQGRPYLEFLGSHFGVTATYFPNFVPMSEIPRDLPERLRNAEINVLFVGLCHAEKGTFELVKGCQLAAESGVKIRLTLIGEEVEEFRVFADALPALCSLTISRLGRQPHSSVLNEMKRNDVFCFPSRREGHSNAINEAMMSGLIILTTRCGFVPDVLGEDAAFYLEEGTSAEIADTIEFIAENRAVAVNCAKRGRAKFLKNFTSDAASDRLNQFYAEALG